MTTVNFNYPKFRYTIASTGQPGAGYKLFTYEEGTSTKKTTWTSLAKTAANTNPVVLDANGEADVWIDGNYKFVLALPTDTDPPTSPVWTQDAIRSSGNGSTVSASSATTNPINGSFELDSDIDGVPDNWTVAAYTGGSVALDNTTQSHGEYCLKFTSVGAGGGSTSTDDYYEVEAGKVVGVRFSIISEHVNTLNKVQVYWYNASKVFLSSSDAYNEGAANPTSWTRYYKTVTAPASAKFARIVITGVDPASTTHSTTRFDNVELDTLFTGELPAELSGVTATAAEINILDGATLSTAELNILDGATLSTAELNILDGVTATAAEINVLDGIPPTLTATELGYVDGVTSSIQAQINAINNTSGVLSLIAASSVGAVGTYAFLVQGSTASPGSNYSGASLTYSGANNSSSTNPAGTWKAMGYTAGGGEATLYLRVS